MKFTIKFACALIIILISTGCMSTQLLPVPKLDRDPNSAIIILKRQPSLPKSAAAFMRVEVYDNDKLVGKLASNDELKWSREEGITRLEVKFLTMSGMPHPEISANTDEFEVKRGSVISFV